MGLREDTDITNPFHQSSFYVEELKYPAGEPGTPKITEDARGQIEALFRDAGIDSMSSEEFLATMVFYGDTWMQLVGIDPLVAKSIFADGVMHGIAFAAGLKADPPW